MPDDVKPEPPHAQHDFGSEEKREPEIISTPRPTKVSTGLFALVRQLKQLQANLKGDVVVEVTIELDKENIYLTNKRFYERVPLG